jgi:hypothetical protein
MFRNIRVTSIITTAITIYGEAETGFIRLITKDRGRRFLLRWYRFYRLYFRVLLRDIQDRLRVNLVLLRDIQDRLRVNLVLLRDLQDRLRVNLVLLRDIQDRLRAEDGIAAGRDKILEVSFKY